MSRHLGGPPPICDKCLGSQRHLEEGADPASQTLTESQAEPATGHMSLHSESRIPRRRPEALLASAQSWADSSTRGQVGLHSPRPRGHGQCVCVCVYGKSEGGRAAASQQLQGPGVAPRGLPSLALQRAPVHQAAAGGHPTFAIPSRKRGPSADGWTGDQGQTQWQS